MYLFIYLLLFLPRQRPATHWKRVRDPPVENHCHRPFTEPSNVFWNTKLSWMKMFYYCFYLMSLSDKHWSSEWIECLSFLGYLRRESSVTIDHLSVSLPLLCWENETLFRGQTMATVSTVGAVYTWATWGHFLKSSIRVMAYVVANRAPSETTLHELLEAIWFILYIYIYGIYI